MILLCCIFFCFCLFNSIWMQKYHIELWGLCFTSINGLLLVRRIGSIHCTPLVIILFQQQDDNRLFVCLNGGFIIYAKGLQTYQCHKMHQTVKPFGSHKEAEKASGLLCDPWDVLSQYCFTCLLSCPLMQPMEFQWDYSEGRLSSGSYLQTVGILDLENFTNS